MPNPNNDVLDVVKLAGVDSPGLAAVVGTVWVNEWDEKKGRGASEGSITFTGRKLSEFDVVIRLYDDSDWQAWDDGWAPLVLAEPDPKNPKAFEIYHPFTTMHKITSVVVTKTAGPVETDDHWTWTISFKKYAKPRPALAKPDGSADTEKKTTEEDPYDRMIRERIARLEAIDP